MKRDALPLTTAKPRRRRAVSAKLRLLPWTLSCVDWGERIRSKRSLMPALPHLDTKRAARAVAIFSQLRLPDVAGTPKLGDVIGDWFLDIVRAVFGSWFPEERARMIREFFLMVPKKSGKTTLGAALMLTAVLMSDRPRAEFLIIAPTLEVSDLAFKQALGMIEADRVLTAKFHIQEHVKRVTFRPTGAFLKIKSFSPKVVTGSKPAGVLLDEIHVIAEAPEADRVIGQLRGGLISQPEAFMFTITTQSERPPSGVFKAELTKARAVRDGTLVAPLLAVLYEFPDGVDWRDVSNWAMVTPNEGRSVSVARLVPDYDGAVAAGEHELRRWASQHLNVEIGIGLKTDNWPGALFWPRCTRPELSSLDELLTRCDAFAIGIDAGGPEDWMALCVLGREIDSRDWLAWGRAWVHQSALDKYKSEAQKWRDFERDGDLVIVEEIGPDVDQLVALCTQVYETGLLVRIGLDPAGSAKVLHEALMIDGGIPEQLFIGIGQGWRLLGITKLVERKLASETLLHGGRGIMGYAVGNARVEMKGNATLITKAASKGKIDPLMALFDAGECLTLAPMPVNPDTLIAPV